MSMKLAKRKMFVIFSLPIFSLAFAGGVAQAGEHTYNDGIDPCYKKCSAAPETRSGQGLIGCMSVCQHPGKQTAKACPSGLVWREKFDGDTLCVLPGERDANRRKRGLSVGAASACPSGLVWRERFDGDTVCVTPLERDENRRRRGLR